MRKLFIYLMFISVLMCALQSFSAEYCADKIRFGGNYPTANAKLTQYTDGTFFKNADYKFYKAIANSYYDGKETIECIYRYIDAKNIIHELYYKNTNMKRCILNNRVDNKWMGQDPHYQSCAGSGSYCPFECGMKH